jgi:parallel beta-helix repeat protein
VAYNNTLGYDPGWEAGGLKLTNTIRLTVRANWVHHNSGPGIWTDINNINTLIESNTVEDNDRIGIFHEISYAAVIRGNTVKRNGFGFSVWAWGGGIVIAASPNVEVYGNLLDGNADNIVAIQQYRPDVPSSYGPHEISNLYVHDNQTIVTSGWTGFVQDVGDTSYFTSRNNRFLANTYTLTTAPALPFTWNNQELTLAQWQAYGLQ